VPALDSFDYSVVRVVPRVDREEFINAGIILFCRTRRFLGARIAFEPDRLRALAPERIVPGHGPVCGPEVLDEVEAYLRFVQDAARLAEESGQGPLEAARACDLGRFGAWHDQERLVGNLHRALSEVRGQPEAKPLDYAGVWAEMVELNGGRPLRCLA